MGGVITDDARCTWEIKFRVVMAKAEFNKKKAVFKNKLALNFWKKLV